LIYDNKLIYSYQYYTEDIRNVEWEEQRAAYREGIYSLDLKTGEEKKLSEGYDKMSMIQQSFYCFDPEKIICMDYDSFTLYLYNLNTGKFTKIDKCGTTYQNFAADGEYVIYMHELTDNEYCCYNIETGEIVSLPCMPQNTKLECIVGDTVWVNRFEEYNEISHVGYDRQGHISKSDFFEGNWDKLSFYE
ncbi:MAG: hypothetical protein K2N36_05255, partial [Ruminiclostridium sp.]|nr:hypothetical protein [Ruminiclostridium sp.]